MAARHSLSMAFRKEEPRGSLFEDPEQRALAALSKLPGSGVLICKVRGSALASAPVTARLMCTARCARARV